MDERRERFEEMVRRCEEPVLSYALRRAPAELARDAAAEAFVAAWRRFDELPPDPLPWLIGTTRRTLANQRRSQARQERVREKLAQRCTTTFDTDKLEDIVTRRAFGRLSTGDREALALIAWDGLTPVQAAHSLDCSPAAFRVRLHRARRRFERALHHESALDRLELTVKEAS